jgi:hypothetical protein
MLGRIMLQLGFRARRILFCKKKKRRIFVVGSSFEFTNFQMLSCKLGKPKTGNNRAVCEREHLRKRGISLYTVPAGTSTFTKIF